MTPQSRDSDPRDLRIERLDPAQAAAYRRMTPAERIEAASATTELVRERLSAHLRDEHPDWPEDRVERTVAARFLGDAV